MRQFFQTRNILRVIIASAILNIVIAPAQPALAQGKAIVHFDPPTLEVGQGQVEKLNIVIDNAQDVYGIDVRAKFDPSVIEIVDTDPSKDGVQMMPGDFIKPDFAVRNIADNQKGTLQYVITQVNPTPPATGSGIVLSIWVRGKALGKHAQITIDSVQIADRHGVKLPVQAQSGTIAVVQPKPPTATPTSQVTPAIAVTWTPPLPPTPSATPAPSIALGTSSDNSLFDVLLVLVALGGCFGAIVIVAIAAFVLLLRPARTKNPVERGNPYQTNGSRWL